jgi:hypothetical protein
MTALTRRPQVANPNGAKGRGWENQILEFFRPLFPKIRRTGSAAYGDGDLAETGVLLIEAKNRKELKLGEWMKATELAVQRYWDHHGKWRVPVLVHKRRYYGTHRAYVTLTVEGFAQLLIYLTTGKVVPLEEMADLTPSDREALLEALSDPFDDPSLKVVSGGGLDPREEEAS